jgi:hypothetical protein
VVITSAPAIATARIVLIKTRVIFIVISFFCRSFACPVQLSNGGLRGLQPLEFIRPVCVSLAAAALMNSC